jgi:uncharacterized protein YggE
MRNTRFWVLAASALTVLLLGGALLAALTGFAVLPAYAQTDATATPATSGGIRTVLTTTTPTIVETATVAATPVAPTLPVTGTSAVTPTATTAAPAWSALTGTVPANVPRTITVMGEGRVSVTPDTAQAVVGVEVVSDSVRAATTEVNATMSAIIAALKEQGIADKDLQTAGFNISVERVTPPGSTGSTTGPEQIRYHVSNSVNVTVHDISKVGSVIDAAVGAGANNVYGINFSVSSPSQPADQASVKALEDARTRAAFLAGQAGLTLGPVVSISEVPGGGPVLPYANRNLAAGLGVGGATSISPGQQEVVRDIEVTFVLQ